MWAKSDEFSIFGRGYLEAPMKVGPSRGKILATPLGSEHNRLKAMGMSFFFHICHIFTINFLLFYFMIPLRFYSFIFFMI